MSGRALVVLMLGLLIAALSIFGVPWPVLIVLLVIQLVIFGMQLTDGRWR